MLTVRDIPHIDELCSMVIRAGLESTNRAIRWPYIAEDHELSPWLKGGEVIFITGINREWNLEHFRRLVEISLQCHASAIVVLTGSLHIPNLEPKWVDICNKAKIPLIEQPYSLPIVTVTERLSNAIIQDSFSQRSKQWFIQQLATSNSPTQPIAMNQAQALGLDVLTELTVAMLLPKNSSINMNGSGLFVISEFLLRYNSPFPITEFYNGWLLIVPTDHMKCASFTSKGGEIWQQFKDELEQHQVDVSIGLSDGYALDQINQMAYEARQCAGFAQEQSQNGIYHYRSFGLHQLFAAIGDTQLQRDFCARYLGVFQHNQHSESETIKSTLRCYFEQLCSLRSTASHLGVHRNTITARLHKFEQLTGLSLNDHTHRLGIQNALLIESMSTCNPNLSQGQV